MTSKNISPSNVKPCIGMLSISIFVNSDEQHSKSDGYDRSSLKGWNCVLGIYLEVILNLSPGTSIQMAR